MEDKAFTSPSPPPQVNFLARQNSNELSPDTQLIEQLQESNRQLKQSLTELEKHYQTLLDNNPQSGKATGKTILDTFSELSSKSHFISEIDARIFSSARYDIQSTLIVIQINPFLEFESPYRLSKVNSILKKINHYLKNIIKRHFIAARLDEHLFALLIDDSKPREPIEVANFIKHNIDGYLHSYAPVNTQKSQSVNCTIGIAAITSNAMHADNLLYQTEVNFNSSIEVNKPEPVFKINSTIANNARDMVDYLLFSLQKNRFKLLFQPLVSLKSNEAHGYEVLIRILDSTGADIPAEEFIPLANLNGLGEALDKIVLSKALNYIQKRGQHPDLLMVTISNSSLTSPTFLNWLSVQLQQLTIDPAFLILQISESDIQNKPKQITAFSRRLHTLGVQKAVCHFSMSNNSFDYLEAFKPNYIKLDKALFSDITYKIRQKNQVRDIINNLHHKGYRVMAPQIEDINLLPALCKIGIDYVQGDSLQEPRENMIYPFIQSIEIAAPAPQFGTTY